MRSLVPYLVFCLLLSGAGLLRAETADHGALSEVYGLETRTVEIATGYAKAIEEAPSVTSVMTAADIEAMGVRTLRGALESVAGFQWQPTLAGFEVVSIRGLNSSFEGRVLLLVDGLPIAQGFGNVHSYRMVEAYPVENIERIEVIRGPGSALYGADAFAGVINVITKTRTRPNSTELGGRLGSFNTYEGWVRHSRRFGPLDVSGYVSGGTTAGYDNVVERDAQTPIDRFFGTRASLAPGPANMGYDRTNADLVLSLGPWHLGLGYFGLQNGGAGFGVGAIDPVGRTESHLGFANLEFRRKLSPAFELSSRISYMESGATGDFRTFPPGAFGGLFPRGTFDGLDAFGRQLRTEATGYWSGLKGHVVTLSGGYYSRDLYHFAQRSNAIELSGPGGTYLRIPRLATDFNLPEGELAVPSKLNRDVTFGVLQDEWQLARDWTLTTGVRLDAYSDYGTTTNPRAALVWSASPHSTYRIGYGRAFRAPGYAENSGKQNNPFGVGGPNLRPETLDSFELGTSLWGESFRINATMFGVVIHDRISTIVGPLGRNHFLNAKEDEFGYGMEWETTWHPTDKWRFRLNYVWQRPTGFDTSIIGTGPEHAIYGEAQWKFTKDWFADLNLRTLVDRNRQSGDRRPPIADYTVVNLSLRRKKLFGNMDMAVSVRNLFDADVREQSPTDGSIYNDFPLDGINAFGEVSFSF